MAGDWCNLDVLLSKFLWKTGCWFPPEYSLPILPSFHSRGYNNLQRMMMPEVVG